VHAGAAGLVGAVRHNAAVLRSASAKLSPHGASNSSGHGSDMDDALQVRNSGDLGGLGGVICVSFWPPALRTSF
jgi:hypothetical protein